jgi:FtsH-binding integral membrane protein
VMMFFPHQSLAVEMIYSGLGALIFSVYIIVDTQKIMRTAHLDDEIPATISLYLDIVNLFLFILRLLQSRNNN